MLDKGSNYNRPSMSNLYSFPRRGLFLVSLAFLLLNGPSARAANSPIVTESRAPQVLPPISYIVGVPIHSGLVGHSLEVPTTSTLSAGSRQEANAIASSSLRGPIGGLFSQIYDWRDPMGIGDPRRAPNTEFQWRNTLATLNLLRVSREFDSLPVFVVNTNGISERFTWPVRSADNPYITHNRNELAELAGDWVHYTNFTLQNFDRLHPPLSDSDSELERQSAAILGSIFWQNRDGSGFQAPLPLENEALPTVQHWEIGNEPNFPIGGFSLDPDAFARRYATITEQMIDRQTQIDPSHPLEVGPALMNLHPPDDYAIETYVQAILATGAHMDFVAYHPYTLLFGPWFSDAAGEHTAGFPDNADEFDEAHLNLLRQNLAEIYPEHAQYAAQIRAVLPEGVGLSASEWNPSRWESSFHLFWRTKSMAHSLAIMETLFSFARLEIGPAHYHTNMALQHQTDTPLYQTFLFLRNHLNGRLLAAYGPESLISPNVRIYMTSGKTGPDLREPVQIWLLNWGDEPLTYELFVQDLPGLYYPDEFCRLTTPSLLHGSLTDAGRPTTSALTEAAAPECQPFSAGLQSGDLFLNQADLTLEAPANGWAYYSLQPASFSLDIERVETTGGMQRSLPGDVISHAVRITNTGNRPARVTFDLEDALWETQLTTGTAGISLDPGDSELQIIQVQIPAGVDDFESDTFTLVITTEGSSDQLEISTQVQLFRSQLAIAAYDVSERYRDQIESLRWLIRRVARSLAWRR
jgi:hypothetical protein